MSHIFKMTEWYSSGSERWYCNDVEDLNHGSGLWWVPARILGISLEDFILLLKNKYKANITYRPDTDTLIYSWNNKEDMLKFKNFINKKAREKKAMV